MICRTIITVLVAVVFLTPGLAGSTPKFRDVLDTPALKSALAAKSLLNGVAVAGKRLVSVGQRGHILYSDDGGKSWTQAPGAGQFRSGGRPFSDTGERLGGRS